MASIISIFGIRVKRWVYDLLRVKVGTRVTMPDSGPCPVVWFLFSFTAALSFFSTRIGSGILLWFRVCLVA